MKDKHQARFETEDQEAAHAEWTEALEALSIAQRELKDVRSRKEDGLTKWRDARRHDPLDPSSLEKTEATLMGLLKEETVVRDAVKEARKAESVAFESAQAAGAVPGGL